VSAQIVIPGSGPHSYLLQQILTFAIPLGLFGVVVVWSFFQRRPMR
jgi:hypothetical protein